ncbi:hypothetical protein RHGRI_010802 [Rhododendron griersonianum]|uniref:Elongation factor P n=1 Tax=Rhododendron griersonianum TaxID=479676 RepID=A0AAV6KKE5_9ERIC|nr:hypothetical protein RHGRI_010802 [Rhododendron griersonianum]
MARIATLKPSTFHCFRLSSSSSSPSPSSLSFASTPLVLPIRVLTGTRRRPKFPKILAFTSNDIKVGTNIEVDGAPWKVIEFLHVKPGKGAAFVRTTLRNYVTGNTVEKTFRAGAKVEQADIFKETKQYTYKDGGQFVFMDLTNYEEFRLDESYVGDKAKWMKEGMDCNLLFWNGKVIGFEVPMNVKLTVVDVDPSAKGDSAQGSVLCGSKPATLETGAVVNVPLFIERDEVITVDTETGQYLSRG